MSRDPYAPVIDASRRDVLDANRRGAAAATAAHHARDKRDVYHRVRDIRAEVAAEDRERGALHVVTDDERREVARRLREYVDLPDDWWQETRAEFYVEKCVFGNVDRHSEAELFTRLADLIEPSDSAQTVAEDMFGQMRHSTEQERVAYADMMARNSVELHPVDRDALLALAVNLDARATELLKVNDLDQSRQRRSARLAHATDLMAACSRIREALGEGES